MTWKVFGLSGINLVTIKTLRDVKNKSFFTLLFVIGLLPITGTLMAQQGTQKSQPGPGLYIPDVPGTTSDIWLGSLRGKQSPKRVAALLNLMVQRGGFAFPTDERFYGEEGKGTACPNPFSYAGVSLFIPDSNSVTEHSYVPPTLPLPKKTWMHFASSRETALFTRPVDNPNGNKKGGRVSEWPFNVFAAHEVWLRPSNDGASPFNDQLANKYSFGIATDQFGSPLDGSIGAGYYPAGGFTWLQPFQDTTWCPCDKEIRQAMLSILATISYRIALGEVGNKNAVWGITPYIAANIALTAAPRDTRDALAESGLTYQLPDKGAVGVNIDWRTHLSAVNSKGKTTPTGASLQIWLGGRITPDGVGFGTGVVLFYGKKPSRQT